MNKPLDFYLHDLEIVEMHLDEIASNIVDIIKVLGTDVVQTYIDDIEKRISYLTDSKLLK